jgi:hypothetical protein
MVPSMLKNAPIPRHPVNAYVQRPVGHLQLSPYE